MSETEWLSKSVLPVSFATLITPNKDKNDVVDLRMFTFLSHIFSFFVEMKTQFPYHALRISQIVS